MQRVLHGLFGKFPVLESHAKCCEVLVPGVHEHYPCNKGDSGCCALMLPGALLGMSGNPIPKRVSFLYAWFQDPSTRRQ